VRTRHRIEGLIALALAASLSSPGHAAATRRARAPTVTQCLPHETILYSGRFTRAVGSVCLAGDRVHYRYGPPGHPAIDVASGDDWSNVHLGWITGGGGGYQRHVRFTVGTVSYVIFEGAYGNLTAFPGRRFSGIYVGSSDQVGTARGCLERPFVAESWTDTLLEHAPLARRSDNSLEEVRDGPWDAWF
jgi:hypothetical protein